MQKKSSSVFLRNKQNWNRTKNNTERRSESRSRKQKKWGKSWEREKTTESELKKRRMKWIRSNSTSDRRERGVKENLREVVGDGINSYGGERETVTNRKTKAMRLSCAGGCWRFAKEKNRGKEKESKQWILVCSFLPLAKKRRNAKEKQSTCINTPTLLINHSLRRD